MDTIACGLYAASLIPPGNLCWDGKSEGIFFVPTYTRLAGPSGPQEKSSDCRLLPTGQYTVALNQHWVKEILTSVSIPKYPRTASRLCGPRRFGDVKYKKYVDRDPDQQQYQLDINIMPTL